MLVTFKTEAYADITMFGDVAVILLKLMGMSGDIPGAIEAEDIPAALARLKEAISGAAPGQGETVGLGTRALPLIELLSAAAKRKCYVVWFHP